MIYGGWSRSYSSESCMQALEPILEAFDLEGVAKFIKAGMVAVFLMSSEQNVF